MRDKRSFGCLSRAKRQKLSRVCADILQKWAYQNVILFLLKSLCDPPGHAAGGKHGPEKIIWDSKQGIGDSRIEIDVHIDAVTRIWGHFFGDFVENLKPTGIAIQAAQDFCVST